MEANCCYRWDRDEKVWVEEQLTSFNELYEKGVIVVPGRKDIGPPEGPPKKDTMRWSPIRKICGRWER